MLYEVELKFPLADPEEMQSRLRSLGATAGSLVEQVDRYFNHPVRDFRETNEAFRIRSAGETNCLTYKGPVLDRATKMRHEIEIPIADGADVSSQMSQMLTLIGFRSVKEVRKRRTPWSIVWEGQEYELAVDVVPSIGTYLEIELVVDEAGRTAARDAILKLAAFLKLPEPERRSYLELVLGVTDPANVLRQT